jgi:hypothetical protein
MPFVCAGALLAPLAAHAAKNEQRADVHSNVTDPMAREAEPIRHHNGAQQERHDILTNRGGGPTGDEHRSLIGDDADYSVHGRTVDQNTVPSNADATFRDTKNARGGGPAVQQQQQRENLEHNQQMKGQKQVQAERAQTQRSSSTGRAWDASDKQPK